MLYDAAEAGGPPSLIVQNANSTSERKTRVYDDLRDFGAGATGRVEPGAIAGAAYWTSKANRSENDVAQSIQSRADARLFLNRQILMFLPEVTATLWHEMTHVYTTLSHGAWSAQGGFVDPQATNNKMWSAFIAELNSYAPMAAIDLVDGGTEYIRNGTSWSCLCGNAHRLA